MINLDQFFAIDVELDVIGLVRESEHPSYFCTPNNAIIFACLGVDGIHYCIVKEENDLENSPVYVISPMMPDHYAELVARNLSDFLSLVITCKDSGALECISYMTEDEFYNYIEDSKIERLKDHDFNNKIERTVLFLKQQFELKEIDNIYEHVQETRSNQKYHAKLVFSKEYYDLLG